MHAGESEAANRGGKEGKEEGVLAPAGAEQEEGDVTSKGIDQLQQEGQMGAISVDFHEETVEGDGLGTGELEGTEEVGEGSMAVKGEEGLSGERIQHIAEESGEKDIPSEVEEEGLIVFSEQEKENKDDEYKSVDIDGSLPDEVSVIDDVDRTALSPEGGAAMDFSETNTEDSDSSYPDDLVPSQL